ncbi:MAG: delta-60 repeat domain-containing protein, partial [Solirubrobacterales bacterium]|nr:delta-60 repeat domain-containing protein [Solirubrobacterales bacterium]
MKTKTTLLRASLASLGIVATLGMAHASAAGPDPSFGDGGRADLSQVKLLREGLEAMAVGRESIFVSTPRGLISRLDTDGDLDMSFGGGDGTAPAAPFLVRLRERSRVPSLAIQKDGKVVVAGSYGPRPLLSRLTTDGTLDPSFGDRGAILNRKDLYGEKLRAFTDVAIDRTGRILVS